MSANLERRYRRVLRLLPGWYRDKWEEDMVAAFLDGWLTGDPEADEYISKAAGPGWAETASVAGLAARLYMPGSGTLRRYFALGQAARNAVLALVLVHAVRGLAALVLAAWSHRIFGWLPAPPQNMPAVPPSGIWPTIFFEAGCAWIVVFALLVLRYYRIARIVAALTIVPYVVWLLQGELADRFATPPVGPWAFWVLLDLAPVLAMTAFHRDDPPVPARPWLLALAGTYLLVWVPLLVLQVTGNSPWVPDFPGLCCILLSLACLAHVPRAWSRQAAGSGVWSLTLALLTADAAAYRAFSIADYLHDSHLVNVSLGELLILAAAAALLARDAFHAQTFTPAPPPYPHPMAA